MIVNKPAEPTFNAIRTSLMDIVILCLDSDPALLPLSAQSPKSSRASTPTSSSAQQDSAPPVDPDDFRFWSIEQAKRISMGINEAFGVQCAAEVITADANVSALTNRILATMEITSSS